MILVVDEGKIYGARYYTVRPVLDHVDWGGRAAVWQEMFAWVSDTIGESSGSLWTTQRAPAPGERWYANNSKFWFRNEADLTAFVLRFS